jgi:ABC-2 type transport system ATP-binding protein
MEPVLRIDGLSKAYGDVVALDGCSLSVRRGQMLGLLGPNGAGKTTAMRAVFGLVRPDAGTVTWDGVPIDRSTRRRFGYMPEERGLYPKLPVRWQLAYLGRLHGMEAADALAAADHWLDTLSLADRAESKVAELSHGNQQRAQLIAALIHDPDLVVLDEPFAGLDPIGASSMAGVLTDMARSGKAVVFSSHQLDVVEELCRDVVILHRGRVVLEGRVRELRAAAPDRYLEVTGGTEDWVSSVPAAEVVGRDDGTIRVRVEDAGDLEDLMRLIPTGGVSQLLFEPPPLSEIFRRAVEG